MPAPEEKFHPETSSSEKSEDEEWAAENKNNGYDSHDTNFEESSTSDDKSED